MQVFADDGTRIGATVDGRQHRNAVVLIHGFPFSSRIWEAQRDALAGDACVICPDLRGAGTSAASAGPYLMETLASDVALLLDALGVERAAFAGHSMGGYVAMAFARMFSERVDRLALVASRLRADDDRAAAARRELAERLESERSMEPAIERLVPGLFSPQTRERRPEVVDRAVAIARANDPAGAAAALRGMALRAPADDIAEDLDVPVLVVTGAHDQLIGRAEAVEIARSFPRGRLDTFEQSAHLPMLEEPQRLTGALQAWLAAPAEASG